MLVIPPEVGTGVQLVVIDRAQLLRTHHLGRFPGVPGVNAGGPELPDGKAVQPGLEQVDAVPAGVEPDQLSNRLVYDLAAADRAPAFQVVPGPDREGYVLAAVGAVPLLAMSLS